MQAGDRIEKFNGVATPTWERVFEEASKLKPGAPASIVVERAGHEELTVSVVMNEPGGLTPDSGDFKLSLPWWIPSTPPHLRAKRD